MQNGKMGLDSLEIVTKIKALLNQIPDPEIPVVSICELGMVKDVLVNTETNDIVVEIMPTYTACPATHQIQSDIEKILKQNGFKVKVNLIYAPAWNTTMIAESALKKLSDYGIAPPTAKIDSNALLEKKYIITCPRCKGTNTVLISPFGSTPCKALFKCNDCHEPFDYFKCHL